MTKLFTLPAVAALVVCLQREDLADGAFPDSTGATWQGLIRFEQLSGPKACGNLEATCAVPWQTLRTTLGLPNADAGMPDKKSSGCSQNATGDAAPWSGPVVLGDRCDCALGDSLEAQLLTVRA